MPTSNENEMEKVKMYAVVDGEYREVMELQGEITLSECDEWQCDYVRVVRCKDCKYRIVNEHYGERGYLKLKAYCDLDTGDPFDLGRCAEDDNWFCADGERRTDETD